MGAGWRAGVVMGRVGRRAMRKRIWAPRTGLPLQHTHCLRCSFALHRHPSPHIPPNPAPPPPHTEPVQPPHGRVRRPRSHPPRRPGQQRRPLHGPVRWQGQQQ